MKIVSIVGARPQFIRAGPVSQAIDVYNHRVGHLRLQEVVVHTGQHYDDRMSEIFFDELKLRKPDYNLEVGSATHGVQTAEMLKGIEEVLLNERPDTVLVYGDTNSTLAGALAAAKLHIPIAHVEAGPRSFNREMPEEINRAMTDHLSSLLFAPTTTAVENLRKEGITEGVHLVGDVMYDAALQHLKLARSKSRVLRPFDLRPKRYVLATVHRAENTDRPDRLQGILSALEELASRLQVVFPVHPRTKEALQSIRTRHTSALILAAPVSYLDTLLLESKARVIITDSGGVQKEAFFFRVPCVTLREETEWVETIQSGWNVLVGTDPRSIVRAAMNAKGGDRVRSPYGKGNAASKLVEVLGGRLKGS
jgi:UDP-GlcNAc3NAcA epimerase